MFKIFRKKNKKQKIKNFMAVGFDGYDDYLLKNYLNDGWVIKGFSSVVSQTQNRANGVYDHHQVTHYVFLEIEKEV